MRRFDSPEEDAAAAGHTRAELAEFALAGFEVRYAPLVVGKSIDPVDPVM